MHCTGVDTEHTTIHCTGIDSEHTTIHCTGGGSDWTTEPEASALHTASLQSGQGGGGLWGGGGWGGGEGLDHHGPLLGGECPGQWQGTFPIQVKALSTVLD